MQWVRAVLPPVGVWISSFFSLELPSLDCLPLDIISLNIFFHTKCPFSALQILRYHIQLKHSRGSSSICSYLYKHQPAFLVIIYWSSLCETTFIPLVNSPFFLSCILVTAELNSREWECIIHSTVQILYSGFTFDIWQGLGGLGIETGT